jgi:hypothetical protein
MLNDCIMFAPRWRANCSAANVLSVQILNIVWDTAHNQRKRVEGKRGGIL